MSASSFSEYINRLQDSIRYINMDTVQLLGLSLQEAWRDNKQIFLCGNGGSAANAMHIANDLFYGIATEHRMGIRAHALTANQSIMTCLANDVSYEDIFSKQIAVLGKPGDLLIALSGSGNSKNIVKAITTSKEMGMKTFGIFGYSGGLSLGLVDVGIHLDTNDMQISEDLQLVIGHMIMQWLRDYQRNSKP